MVQNVKVRMRNHTELEGYVEGIVLGEHKGKSVLSFNLTNFHVTKPNDQGKSKGYGLPIMCRCNGTTAARVFPLLREDDLILVEGKLRYHKQSGTYSLQVVHVEHMTPVLKPVEQIDFSDAEEIE